MSTSKLQKEVSMALSIHLGGYTIRENTRPEWLTDDTGARLELDFTIEELNVAIEVQGAQHYVFTPHFHSNHKAFVAAMRRDEFKQRACLERGVKLHEVASSSEIFDMTSDIIANIPEEIFVPQKMKAHPIALSPKGGKVLKTKPSLTSKRTQRKLRKHKLKIYNVVSRGGLLDLQFHAKNLEKFCAIYGFDYEDELQDAQNMARAYLLRKANA